MPGARDLVNAALGAGFLCALAVPGVLAYLEGSVNVERAGATERRRPSALPPRPVDAASLKAFPGAFDAWFKDAWGGREQALRWNARASLELFGTSPSSHLRIGPGDWVFSGEHRAFESFAGVDPMGEGELEDWRRCLEDRRRWLAGRGIDHVVAFVPHKSSIYPDELPPALREARGQSRLEQFTAHMAESSSVELLDLSAALRERRTLDAPRSHAYSPHGVHWTAVGAHAGYEVLAAYLEEHHGGPAARGLAGFEVIDEPGDGDSWARRMYLDGVLDMENLELVPRDPAGIEEVRRPKGAGPKDRRWTGGDEGFPRVLVVHDSFGPDLLPRLALQTEHLESRWRAYLERNVVDSVAPDVVIELYSELALESNVPFRRAEFLGPDAETEFGAASVLRRWAAGETLQFDPGPERVEQALEGDVRRIKVTRGVGYLSLGAVGESDGKRLWLALDLGVERSGPLAVFRGPKLDATTPIAEMLPIEASAEDRRILVPLPRGAATDRIWVVIPRGLGAVRFRGAELRAGE